jgi:8-oxo-dGTP diphosphatase
MRSGVIILEDDRVALIERVRDGHTYYVFPGGTIESDETAEAAAAREAYEELGVHIQVHTLAAVVTFRTGQQYYYHATIHSGQFGTGTGQELTSGPSSARGSYRPIWLTWQELTRYDIRPHALAQAVAAGVLSSLLHPLRIDEA